MAIQNVGISSHASSFVSPVASNISAPADGAVKSSQPPQVSASVTLSVQGQRQSQANPTQGSNTVNTPITPNAVPQSKETNAAPGIQFMAGESKGGRVNTYA